MILAVLQGEEQEDSVEGDKQETGSLEKQDEKHSETQSITGHFRASQINGNTSLGTSAEDHENGPVTSPTVGENFFMMGIK